MVKLNSRNSLYNNFLIIKSRSRYTMYLLLLISSISFGQTFDSVGCRLKYEGMFNMNVIDNKLYNSGIYEMCGDTLNSIGMWNDTSWKEVDSGVIAGNVYCFTKYKNAIYVGGTITIVGSNKINVRGIAKIVNNKWDTVSYGIGFNTTQDKITSLEIYQNELYAAGKFTEIDGKPAQSIAKWDGEKWTVIPGVQSSFTQVNCMAVYKNELYVGGHFWTAGGKPANFIARWNGTEWNSLGTGVNSQVTSMVVDTIRNLLYVGGYFGGVNDTIKGEVLMWDGINWHQLNNNNTLFNKPGAVMSLEMYNGYLYAGALSNNNLQTDTVFARWDGIKWQAILGINGNVNHLKYYKGKLYLAGSFTKINNDTIPYLASYYSPDSVTVGINTNKQVFKNTIKIYPNPSKDLLQIESQIKINSYKIYDLNGSVIQEEKINKEQSANTTFSISINKLNKGIYFIHVFDETQRNIGTEKFIIE